MKRKKVLIIDDNSGVLFAMKQALELKEYEVFISESYLGVEEVVDLAPDMIYLDVTLIAEDGREIARELKADPRTKQIPIIILTGHLGAHEFAVEAGADDALSKPFELEGLWALTEKYTSQSN